MKSNYKQLNVEVFKDLAKKGLNCKEIANKMGCHPHTFGFKMKDLLGIYPSVYIARLKNGTTKNSIFRTRRND